MNYLWKFFGIGGYDKFIEAITEGNVANAKSYFKSSYVDKRNIKGLRPIQLACMSGNISVIKFLIENKCDTSSYQDDEPPFHNAYKSGNPEIVRYLLRNKYGLESSDAFGMRPIHWACLLGDKEIVTLLIGYRCELDCRTVLGATPLDIAIQYKHDDCEHIMRAAIDIMPFVREHFQLELKAAMESYEKFRNDKKICSICLDREIDCVLGCGHPFCMDCGRRFDACPNCRASPTNPKRLFLD